jgi:hypothetical protein
MTLPSIEKRLETLLQHIAEFERPCKACHAKLYFVRHKKSGAITPYTANGLNHFIACPSAPAFRRQREAAHA